MARKPVDYSTEAFLLKIKKELYTLLDTKTLPTDPLRMQVINTALKVVAIEAKIGDKDAGKFFNVGESDDE